MRKKFHLMTMIVVLFGSLLVSQGCSKSTVQEEVGEVSGQEARTEKSEETVKETVGTTKQSEVTTEIEKVSIDEDSNSILEFEQECKFEDFIVCEGDEKYFVPMTEDYVMTQRDPNPLDELEEYTVTLIAFDEEGLMVQYVIKMVNVDETEAAADMKNFINGGTLDASIEGFVENSIAREGNTCYMKYNTTKYPRRKEESILGLIETASYMDGVKYESISDMISSGIKLNLELDYRTTWFSQPYITLTKEKYNEYQENFGYILTK